MSNEAIIAIVALIAGLPPTLLILWHCIKRCMGMPESSASSDVESSKLANARLMMVAADGEGLELRRAFRMIVDVACVYVSAPGQCDELKNPSRMC